MQDTKKTKKQLIQELVALRQRLAACEAVDMQHQQTADTLCASAAHFRLAVNTAPIMVWMSGPDALGTDVNAPWSLWTGRTFAQELDDGWMEGIHPDDLSSCLETYRATVQARQPFRMEYRLRHADGGYRWMMDNGVPRFTRHGLFAGYIGSCIDITERKRAEEALTQAQAELERRVMERTAVLYKANERLVQEIAERTRSEQALWALEERWRSLVEDAPDTILEVDQRGTIRLTNRAMPGLTRAETVGTRFVDHLPVDQRPVLQDVMDQAYQIGATQHCEITVSSPQGTVTWWSYRVSALTRTDIGNGFLVVGTDITAYKATERALKQQNRLAAMGTLAAGIAHEINNPLGAIRLSAEHARSTHTRPQAASEQMLLSCIEHAMACDAATRQVQARRTAFAARLAHLTPREREVLDLVLAGRLNKEIALRLATSQRTVELHRSRIMQKLHAESAADLARQVFLAQGT